MKRIEEKIKYYKLVEEHRKLVKKGKYQEGRKILDFFKEGRIMLGFSDVDNNLENILEKIGFPNSISSRSWNRTFYLK